MSTLNYEELGSRITTAARTGGKDGFIIKMGRKTGNKFTDPLGEEEEEKIYDEERRFYRRSMSTQDYRRYLNARTQLAKETNDEKRIDLTLRMYEYLAFKFFGMTHDEFVNADFDDVVVATLACDALFGSGTTTPQQSSQSQQPVTKRLPYPRMEAHTSKNTYYKSPDEE